MKLIMDLYRSSHRRFWLAVLSGAISGLAAAALVALINHALAAEGSPSLILVLAFFGLCLLAMLSKQGAEILLLRLTQGAIYEMRIRLSQRLLSTPLEQLQNMGKHRLQVILTEDIATLTNAFEWLPVLFVNSIVIIACLGYLLWLSGIMVLILVSILFTGLMVFHFAERRPLAALAEARQQKDVLYRHLRSLIEGTKELKLSQPRATHFINNVLAPAADTYRQRFERGMGGYAWVGNIGTQIFYVNIGLLLFVAPHWFPQPGATLTSFAVTLLYLIKPIVESMIALPELRQASLSLARIHELERNLPPSSAETLPGNLGFDKTESLQISLKNIYHRYSREEDDKAFEIGPINLEIRPGEVLFLIGGNGSGKSTLALLLLGLLTPNAGSLRVNDLEINDRNRDSYRQLFSAVFAEFHLFEHLPGAESTPRLASAQHYLKLLRLQHKVSIRDGQFSTTALSTGQRKRLALVCAYLEDRPVYLFDEWAADQDPDFKRVFYTELLPELQARGKTVIVITHDDNYFGCADRIVKLEDGLLNAISLTKSDMKHYQQIHE